MSDWSKSAKASADGQDQRPVGSPVQSCARPSLELVIRVRKSGAGQAGAEPNAAPGATPDGSRQGTA